MVISDGPTSHGGKRAFTLVEMIAVIAIMVVLLSIGVGLMNGTGAQSRKTAVDRLSGLIEQARTTAIVSRSYVALAIAEPGLTDSKNNPLSGDDQCRVGLLKIADWNATSRVATLIQRWQPLNSGVVLLKGSPSGGTTTNLVNPMDQPTLELTYGADTKARTFKFTAMVFTPRGGVIYPEGSQQLFLRIAEGGYRGKPAKATANLRGGQSKPTENILKIGRVTARPYRSN